MLKFQPAENGSLLRSLQADGRNLIDPSPLGFTGGRVAGVTRRAHNSEWRPLWGKRAVVPDRFRDATIDLTSYRLVARAYDEGVAFRYDFPPDFKGGDERTTFHFSGDFRLWCLRHSQSRRVRGGMILKFHDPRDCPQSALPFGMQSIGACRIMKKWECAFVRTTIELPDPLFREVKATAARQGMRLKDYVTEALQDKLAKRPTHAEKPWMKFAGIAANDPEMVAELKRIEEIVDENFEQIEEQEWK